MSMFWDAIILHLQTSTLLHQQLAWTEMKFTLEDQLKWILLTLILPLVMIASLWVMVANKINVLNVTCGPRHGISVWRFGKYPNE